MAAPIIPWQPSNIPSEIQQELNRRKVNRSFNYIGNQTANWDKKTGDWNTYRGPMVSWIRMCSNGAGKVDSDGNPIKPRFVMNSGKGFYETFGFKPSAAGAMEQVLGFTPDGIPHTIQNSLTIPNNKTANHPIHVATPEISRIDVVVQKELFRRVNIEWVCFSPTQLEYLTPYFLIPGLTVMIEWGWNHFNPTSLVPLHDVNHMQQIWKNSYPLYTDNILRSKGNYDVIYGIISNFNWSVEGNKIVCSTEITSKDRLYAGVVKDSSLTVRTDQSKSDEPDGIFQSIKDFLTKDDTIQNIKTIASSRTPLQEVLNISSKNTENSIWGEIFRPILENKNPETYSMKSAYVHGVFYGRTKEQYVDIGKPDNHDFDYGLAANDGDKLWINFGLIVEILNYFSALPGGKGKPMFTVDIMNSVIGGHPNLISCDPRVLVPNYQAPKFHYGGIGMRDYMQKDSGGSDYVNQYAKPTSVPKNSGNLADEQLGRLFYQFAIQGNRSCYRSDLDALINKFRYDCIRIRQPLSSWSFPSKEDNNNLPNSNTGLKGNFLEKDRSGLLSNIYISFNAFKESVDKGISNKTNTYVEIYEDLLKLLNDSTDGFWDLALVESENNMTITDKRYIGAKPISLQGDEVFSFEYYEADSLIKALKFRPSLTDAQAIRTIFGETNNKKSKYVAVDKNDLLDYKFHDAVIFNQKEREQDDASSDISKRSAAQAKEQIRNMVSKVQVVNVAGDAGLQMSTTRLSVNLPAGVPTKNLVERREIFKLILPDQQLLRLLLDDRDEDNNPRYCAVQPGITLELTILGVGGIRTFQYFLVKNLPEPYSDKNIIFRVTDVHQTLESGNWETVIRAQLLPLRKYIKNRLRGPWSTS
jgi:hypothetical protein